MDKKQIEECIEKGLTLTETSRELCIPKASLQKFCKKEGMFFKSVGKIRIDFTDDQIDIIRHYIENGCSAKMLSYLLGINEYVIERIKKENKISKITDCFILSQNGSKMFSESIKHLPLHEMNDLYIEKCNEVMDEIDILRNSIFKNQYYDKYRESDLNDWQLQFLKDNYKDMSIKDIAKEINSTVGCVTRQIYNNRLFYYKGLKHRLIIDSEEFDNDIANKNMTTTVLGHKYNVSSSYISKERKRRFGVFRNKYNPGVTRSLLEYKVEEALVELDILCYFQYEIEKEVVDFYLGHMLIIECYGEYWHKDNKHDKEKIEKITKNGYKVLIIQEKESEDIPKLKEKISDFYYGSLYEEIHKENLVNTLQSGVCESMLTAKVAQIASK